MGAWKTYEWEHETWAHPVYRFRIYEQLAIEILRGLCHHFNTPPVMLEMAKSRHKASGVYYSHRHVHYSTIWKKDTTTILLKEWKQSTKRIIRMRTDETATKFEGLIRTGYPAEYHILIHEFTHHLNEPTAHALRLAKGYRDIHGPSFKRAVARVYDYCEDTWNSIVEVEGYKSLRQRRDRLQFTPGQVPHPQPSASRPPRKWQSRIKE